MLQKLHAHHLCLQGLLKGQNNGLYRHKEHPMPSNFQGWFYARIFCGVIHDHTEQHGNQRLKHQVCSSFTKGLDISVLLESLLLAEAKMGMMHGDLRFLSFVQNNPSWIYLCNFFFSPLLCSIRNKECVNIEVVTFMSHAPSFASSSRSFSLAAPFKKHFWVVLLLSDGWAGGF